MKPPTSIVTPRLRLRVPSADDAASVFEAYAQDPEVTRFVSWSSHPSVDVTRKFLAEYCAPGWARGDALNWLITLADGGHTAGMIELRVVGCRAEMGYVLARPHWGRGLMTEAARALADWALGEAQIHRVWAVVHLENLASQRVLEKVGMEREGVLRRWTVFANQGPTARDVWCYARIAARKAAP